MTATKHEMKVISVAMQVIAAYKALRQAEEENSSKTKSYMEKFKQALSLLDGALGALAKANVKAAKDRKPELEGAKGPPAQPFDWSLFLNTTLEGVKRIQQVREDFARPAPRAPRKARVIDIIDVDPID